MQDVYHQEEEFLAKRDKQLKENDKLVTHDVKEQCDIFEQEHVIPNQTMQQKQQFISEGLTNNQKLVIANLDEQTDKLEKEQTDLLHEQDTLQEEVRELTKDNQVKKTKNSKLEA